MSESVIDLYSRAAGIDIHQSLAVVSAIVPIGDDPSKCRFVRNEFDTFTEQGLKSLVEFLSPLDVEMVLMESTGVYWMAPYDALLEAGINVAIGNAHEIRGMRGRKTDRNDADWLARVAKHGSFHPSYVPGREYRGLRSLARYATSLRGTLSSEKNRLGKLFNAAGYRLNSVFSDMFGTGGMICVRGVLNGERPEEILGKVPAPGRYKHTRGEMLLALGGKFEDGDLFAARSVLETIDHLEGKISECVGELERIVRDKEERKLELLQTIPGIDALAACLLLAELGGGGLEAFESAEALCAWAGLCPSQNESAGKSRPAKSRKGNKYLRRDVCECASSAVKTRGTTMRSKFQHFMQRGKGYKKSIMAMGRKLLTYVYYVLKKNQPYVDPKIDYQKQHAEKNFQRFAAQLRRCTTKYDIQIINRETGEAV
jgi:transposase